MIVTTLGGLRCFLSYMWDFLCDECGFQMSPSESEERLYDSECESDSDSEESEDG